MSVSFPKRWVKKRLKQIEEHELAHGKIALFEFNTVIIIGPTGCGKTLTLTWIGNNFAIRGFEVFANYETSFAHYVTDPFELLTSEGILLIDEMQKYVNARLSSDSRTLFYSELASEARKSVGPLGSLYATSQRFKNVDIKVRNNVVYVLFPEYNKELHWCTVFAFEGLEYEKPLDIFEFDCIPIYKMFKTREKVQSVYTPDQKKKLGELLLRTMSKEQIQDILEAQSS